MRSLARGAFLFSILVLAGCGGKRSSLAPGIPATGIPTAKQAGQTTYKYAFTGQVLDASTHQAVKQFSISLLAQDPAVNTVVNALGNLNGLFHISRTPSGNQTSTNSLPAIISAPGFQPLVQQLSLGADCQTADCSGAKPLSILLQPLFAALKPSSAPDAGGPSPSASGSSTAFSPTTLGQIASGNQFQNLLQSLAGAGKLDPSLQNLLSTAGSSTSLSNILVLLNGSSGQQTANVVSQLLGNVTNPQLNSMLGSLANGKGVSALLPLLTAGNPGVGTALAATSALLPYLVPLLKQMSGSQGGALGQLLTTLATGGSSTTNLNGLLGLLQKSGGSNNAAQLAFAGILPLVQGLSGAAAQAGTQHPFLGLLGQALNNPSLSSLITSGASGGSKNLSLLLTYLQPLLQGLTGSAAPQLATLFNQLVQSGGGLDAIKNLPRDLTGQAQFAQLIPFIQPLIDGLNSGDAAKLTQMLAPALSGANPAATLLSLLTQGVATSRTSSHPLLGIASSLFPNLQQILSQGVPGKQVLGAQLLQGLLSGSLQSVNIQQDLQGSSAVMVAGLAQDLLKLAQLPNVERLIAVGGNH